MAINSVSLLNNNSALELVKANAVQFSNKNNSLNKVTTEKESNKLNAIKDSVNISKEALAKLAEEMSAKKDSDINSINPKVNEDNEPKIAKNSSTDDIDDKLKSMYEKSEGKDNKSGEKLNATNAQTEKCNNATTSSSVAYKLAALKVKKAYC